MSYTMADFQRDFVRKHFTDLLPEERREILASLPPEDRRDMLASLPPEERLAGLSEAQIRQYLERLAANRQAKPRKPRRKR